MIKIKPNFVYDKKEKKIGVILSIKDFEAIIDELEDYQDYQLIKKCIEKKEKLYVLEEIVKDTKERLNK